MSFDYPNPDPELIPEFLEWLKSIDLSINTIDSYRRYLQTINNDMRKKKITNTRKYFGNKDLAGILGKKIAYRSYLKFLWREKNIITAEQYQEAILEYFKLPRSNRNKKSENIWAEPFENWENIIRKAPNKIAKFGLWVGFNFGLRLGEIIHLRVKDIDFQGQELHICIQKQNEKKHQESWRPKYDHERSLPIADEQAETFKKWIDTVRPKNLEHPYLLWTPRGKRKGQIIKPRSFQYWCSRVGIHAHILRYSFATYYYNLSLDVKLISELLGHANVSTTSDYLKLGKKNIMSKGRALFEGRYKKEEED